MEQQFEVSVDVASSPPSLRLRGEFDVAGEAEFYDALREVAVHDGSGIVIDVAELTFLGSTALRGFVEARRSTGGVTVVGAGPWLRKIFSVAEVDNLFSFA